MVVNPSSIQIRRIGVLPCRRSLENFDACGPIAFLLLAIRNPQWCSRASGKPLDIFDGTQHLRLIVVLENHFRTGAPFNGDRFGGGVYLGQLSFENFFFCRLLLAIYQWLCHQQNRKPECDQCE